MIRRGHIHGIAITSRLSMVATAGCGARDCGVPERVTAVEAQRPATSSQKRFEVDRP